jgi:hypothetical protein
VEHLAQVAIRVYHGYLMGPLVFNTYKHGATFMIRNNNGTEYFLYNRQGFTQGDLMVICGYATGLIPLVQ